MIYTGISEQQLKTFKQKFEVDSKNKLAQNVVCKYDLLDVCVDRTVLHETHQAFTHRVSTPMSVYDYDTHHQVFIRIEQV